MPAGVARPEGSALGEGVDLLRLEDFARVLQAGRDVLARQPGIVSQDVAFGPTLGQVSRPMIRATASLVPRTTGLPARMPGSMATRSDQLMATTSLL